MAITPPPNEEGITMDNPLKKIKMPKHGKRYLAGAIMLVVVGVVVLGNNNRDVVSDVYKASTEKASSLASATSKLISGTVSSSTEIVEILPELKPVELKLVELEPVVVASDIPVSVDQSAELKAMSEVVDGMVEDNAVLTNELDSAFKAISIYQARILCIAAAEQLQASLANLEYSEKKADAKPIDDILSHCSLLYDF